MRVATPAEGLARLRTMARGGELAALCRRHGIRVLTVFGSAARGAADARDLDIGVLTDGSRQFDAAAAVDELVGRTGVSDIDLAHLNRGGPLIRERALVGSILLFEDRPGSLANAQMSAIAERMETDRFRRLALELLAS